MYVMLWKSVLNLIHLKMTMAIAELSIIQQVLISTFKGNVKQGWLIIYTYFANATTDLTAYSLEHYDEVKDIIDCHLICKKTCKYYNEDTSGNIYTKSFEVRIQTIENYVGKLISPMPRTFL